MSRYTKLRKRRLEEMRLRATPRPVGNEGPESPNPDSVEIMREIDRMPKRWRKLVHEHGYVVVSDMLSYGYEYDNAMMDLEMRWLNRQKELLS